MNAKHTSRFQKLSLKHFRNETSNTALGATIAALEAGRARACPRVADYREPTSRSSEEGAGGLNVCICMRD